MLPAYRRTSLRVPLPPTVAVVVVVVVVAAAAALVAGKQLLLHCRHHLLLATAPAHPSLYRNTFSSRTFV